MKKLAVLATTLILGASSAALATPSVTPSYAPAAGYRPHPSPRPLPQHATWKTLSSSAKLSMRGTALVNVSTHERFSKLKLDAAGSMFVDKVAITFANGKTQIIELDRWLDRRSPALTLDLEGNRGRQIDKIVVYGRGRGGFRSAGFSLMAV